MPPKQSLGICESCNRVRGWGFVQGGPYALCLVLLPQSESPGHQLLRGTQQGFWVCGTEMESWVSITSPAPQCFRIQGQDPQDRVKWSEAQFSCEQQEAQLLTIANPLEQGRVSLWGGTSVLHHSRPATGWSRANRDHPITPSLLPFFWGGD